MSSASQSTTPEHTLARVDAIHKELADQLNSITWSNRIATLIGVALIGLIGGYFYYGYSLLKQLEPKTLVDAGERELLDRLPGARRELEQKIIGAAPDVAQMMSHSVLENLPETRKSLDELIKKRTDTILVASATSTTKQLEDFVKNNKKELQDSFKIMKDNNGSEKVLQLMIAMMEKDIGRNIREEAKELVVNLRELNDRLDKIKKGEKLTLADQNMRRVLMICKRLLADRPPADDPEAP